MNEAIILAITLIPKLLDYIDKTRTAAIQSAEWTPEQEAAYQAMLLATAKDRSQLPDALVDDGK